MDVKSAFLDGFLEDEVYIEQLMRYKMKGHEDKVLKLNKALCGLKQALRNWYSRVDGYFLENRFVKRRHEYAIYVKIKGSGDIVILCLYVNDLIIQQIIQRCLKTSSKQ
jgi:hypothetical protein